MVPLWMIPQALDRRERLRPQAVRAGALRRDEARAAAPGGRAARRRASTSSTAAARPSRRSSTTPTSRPSASSARPRSAEMLYARGAAASASARCAWAAPRTTSSWCPTPTWQLTAAQHRRLVLRLRRPALHGRVADGRGGRRRAHHRAHRRSRRASCSLGEDMGAIITAERTSGSPATSTRPRRRAPRCWSTAAAPKVRGRAGHWVGPTVLDHVTARHARRLRGDLRARCCPSSASPRSTRPSRCRTRAATATAPPSSPSSGAVAAHVVEQLEAGMVGVNVGVPVPREPFGFGGWNESKFGHGDITGWDGFRFWTAPRKVTDEVGAADRRQLDVLRVKAADLLTAAIPQIRGLPMTTAGDDRPLQAAHALHVVATGDRSTRCPSRAPRACTSTRPRASASSTSTAS